MMVVPGVFFYVCFSILPILMGLMYSLTDWKGYGKKHFIGFKNFINIFQDDRFFNSLLFTLKYTVALVFFLTIVSLVLALLLNAKIKGRGFYRSIYFFPAVLSMLTVSLIFNQIYLRVYPAIANATGWALFSGVLSSPRKAFWSVLFVNIWKGVTIPSILFLAGLQTVPLNLEEAAILDGASVWQRFKNITVPFLIPTFNVVIVLALKGGILVFDSIMAMTNGGPGGATESISFLIYRHAFVETNKFSYSIAESIIAGLIICLISTIQIKYSEKKEISL